MSDPKLTNPLEYLLGYQLRRASAVMMADLGTALSQHDMRPAEASILMVVDANPGCTQSDVGRTLGVKRTNMVPLIAALMKADLIERSAVDGRSQALRIKPEGEALVAQVKATVAAHEERFQSLLESAELLSVTTSLRTLREEGAPEL